MKTFSIPLLFIIPILNLMFPRFILFMSVCVGKIMGALHEKHSRSVYLSLSFAVFFCLLLSLPSFFFCPSLDSTRSDEPRGATIAKASRNQLFLWIFDEAFRFGHKRLLIHQARRREGAPHLRLSPDTQPRHLDQCKNRKKN